MQGRQIGWRSCPFTVAAVFHAINFRNGRINAWDDLEKTLDFFILKFFTFI